MSDELLLSFDRGPVCGDARLGRHLRHPVKHDPAALPNDVRAAAMHGWEERARAEYTGVMLMRRFHELTVESNAPMDVQELAARLVLSEQEHTAMCIDAACSLGSMGELAFDDAELHVGATADHADELFDVLVGLFLVGEVVAMDVLSYTLAHTTPSSYRDVLRQIARDEIVHARVGRVLLRSLREPESRWAPYPGDGELRRRVRAHVAAMRARDVVRTSDVALCTDPTKRAALASLGIAPPEGFKERYMRALRTRVPRELAAIGLTGEVES